MQALIKPIAVTFTLFFLILTFSLALKAFQNNFSTLQRSVKYLEKYTSKDSLDYELASKLISSKIILLGKIRKQSI